MASGVRSGAAPSKRTRPTSAPAVAGSMARRGPAADAARARARSRDPAAARPCRTPRRGARARAGSGAFACAPG
jgi:hypothetical protein